MRTAAAEVDRLSNSLELLKQQRQAVRELADRGLYPELKVVQVERQYSDDLGELAKAKASLDAAEAAMAEAASRLEGLETERLSEVLGELAQATAERDRLAEQLRAQDAILASLEVAAPAAGIVQEIVVTAPGQAVAAHETLMKLVPQSEGLVVEAKVANEDVGRLRPGMPATVKVRAFDYLRFGTLDGVLQKVAADATPDPRTGELTYAVTVVTDRGASRRRSRRARRRCPAWWSTSSSRSASGRSCPTSPTASSASRRRSARAEPQDGRRCGPVMLRTSRLPSVILTKVNRRSAKPLQRWKNGAAVGRPSLSKSSWPSSSQ